MMKRSCVWWTLGITVHPMTSVSDNYLPVSNPPSHNLFTPKFLCKGHTAITLQHFKRLILFLLNLIQKLLDTYLKSKKFLKHVKQVSFRGKDPCNHLLTLVLSCS